MRLGKTALYHFGTQVVISVSGFLATFAIGVFGGSADLGNYTLAVAVGFFWLAIPISGVAQAVNKRMSEGADPGQYFGGGLALNGVLVVCLTAVVSLTSWLLQVVETPNQTIVRVIVEYDVEIVILLVGAAAIKTVLFGLQGQKRVARAGALRALDRVVRSGSQVALILLGFGVAAITLGHAASLLFVSIVAIVLAPIRPSVPRLEHLRGLGEYAKYAWVGALRSRVYGWLDTLVLGIFLTGTTGASLIGIYEVAWGIGSLLATASASISSTLFPEMSDLSSDGDYDRVAHFLDEALAFSGVIVLPGLVGAITIGERILRFYSGEYVRGYVVLVILVGAYTADVYANQLLNTVNAVDRPDASMRVNAVFILVNVVLNVVLVWQFSWVGAAVATAVSASVRTAGGGIVVHSILEEVPLPIRPIGSQVVASIAMGGAIVLLAPSVPAGRLWTISLVGAGATIYFTVLIALSGRFRTKVQSLVPAVVSV